MILINYSGRLGNNMLQYAAAKIFSDKFKLKIITNPSSGNIDFSEIIKSSNEEIDYKIYDDKKIIVNDKNFLYLLSKDVCERSTYIFDDFFQIKEFVTNYIKDIKNIFNINRGSIDDVFLHYRIGDIEFLKNMLPLNYYIEALEKIGVYKGIITSDSPDHYNVKFLSDNFNLKILSDDPLKTIILGSKYNNIILSEGTFSWWIGVLSDAKKIIYNERERFWHGDIFCYDNWIKLNYI